MRSPLKTAYLRISFSQCHQILTKLSFKAPPRTALPVGSRLHWWRLATPMLFPASFYFFDFSFKSVLFQFGDFIIFIVLYLLFIHFLRDFCREQRLFLSGWIFSSFIISFPISTALLLRPTHRIDFKVLTALLGFGYERLTFQGGVPTLPRIVLSLNPALRLGHTHRIEF